MPRDIAKNDLDYARFTDDSTANHSIVSTKVTPSIDNNGYVHARKFLLNGSNFNLAVDGSVTPVVFQIDIQPTELFLIDNIELTLTDKGNVNDLEDFMVITGGLTNGLLIDATLANPSPAVTVRTNYGLLNRMGTGSSLSQIGQDSVFSGRLHFNAPVIVDGSQGHNIRVTVRDDLTGLLLSTVAVSGVVKVIS